MAEITNVNLAYQRKVRGVAPLSRFGVHDDGSLLISAPDEMEVRTFHVVRFSTFGKSQVVETYSVETLRKTEIAADGSACIGSTDDDLYLFSQKRKSRFLPDRRASYIDLAFAATGPRFAAAFSDMLGSGHTVALGDIGGRLLWTKDISFPVSRIAIDRAAQHLLVAGDSGDIVLLDDRRAPIWTHRQEAPVRAVALSNAKRVAFACGGSDTERGGVGLIENDGRLDWFTELVGIPVEVAISSDGKTVAALLQTDSTAGRLVFLSSDGNPIWDVEYEDARPTGLSLSETGRYAAVSLRDGTIAVYELQYGERMAELSEDAALAEARAAKEHGGFAAAASLLRARLESVPNDCNAGELYPRVLTDLKTQTLERAAVDISLADFVSADRRLADAQEFLPLDPDVFAARRELHALWRETKLSEGAASARASDVETAEAAFLSALLADPTCLRARIELAEVRRAAAQAALVRGRGLLAIGDAPAALIAFVEARQRGASGPELTELVRGARVVEALGLGNALYQDRQYAAALFQFKKVLRLDPSNPDALQKISYAQNFLQDTQLNDRFSRLE